MRKLVLISFSLYFILTISSCRKETQSNESVAYSDALDEKSAEDYMPDDPKLAEKYKRSCFMCHSNTDAGAPLTKDKTAWQERLDERGLEVLLKHSIEGYNAMPAKGQCMDCTNEELEELIKFMADIH